MKRIAYIGLSYPLLYDYENRFELTQNDLEDDPNPIIESPLGLMILYDELWFLCESICPYNMRKLPYVKFVDRMFKDFYFEGAKIFMDSDIIEVDYNKEMDYDTILKRMNLVGKKGFDTHTHVLKLGNIEMYANSNVSNLNFDIYVFNALKEMTSESIEFVSNSKYRLNEGYDFGKDTEAIEKIIIPSIPNYLGVNGPYHKCMEELRENKYLADFRKWIIQNHNNIQKSEINEISKDINNSIEQAKNSVFKKYLDDNDKYSFFTSTAQTLFTTAVGIPSVGISIISAISNIALKAGKICNVKNDRWQGFVVDAQNIANNNNL